jgi:hypothetical protein
VRRGGEHEAISTGCAHFLCISFLYVPSPCAPLCHVRLRIPLMPQSLLPLSLLSIPFRTSSFSFPSSSLPATPAPICVTDSRFIHSLLHLCLPRGTSFCNGHQYPRPSHCPTFKTSLPCSHFGCTLLSLLVCPHSIAQAPEIARRSPGLYLQLPILLGSRQMNLLLQSLPDFRFPAEAIRLE